MTRSPLTLDQVRKSEKITPRGVGVADFLSKDELDNLRSIRAKHRNKKKRVFNDSDADVAEIIARFGYDTYKAWKRDEIDEITMNRLLMAERARDRQNWLPLEGLLRALIQGGVPTFHTKKAPKIGKQVPKILEKELKMARGEM